MCVEADLPARSTLVSDLSLVDRILAVHDSLESAGVPHAFGGALALAYHTNEVRATKDIDVNIFVVPHDVERVFVSLPDGVSWSTADADAIRRDGQVRLWWDDTPVDLFFDLHEIHQQAADHVRRVPFAGTELPVLGSTELTVFKMMFSLSEGLGRHRGDAGGGVHRCRCRRRRVHPGHGT